MPVLENLFSMKIHSMILAACLFGSMSYAATDNNEKLPNLIYRSNAVYSVLEAAEADKAEVIEARIKEGCDVNQKDELGNTALHLAAKRGADKCVALLLSAGADAMVQDASGKTALELADSDAVKSLLQQAMAARKVEIELCAKVMAGDMDALATAMKSGDFNPNMLDGDNSRSLLMLVCAYGDAAAVTALIKAGADVDFVAPDTRSVLHKAVDRNDGAIIRALLDGGADPMAQSGNKATPLHDAVWSSKEESLKALMPAYKHVNYSPQGGFNGTPINLAIDRNFAHLVRLFIEAGIDLNNKDNGELPLVHAAVAGRAACIEVLLKAGASKTAKGKNGKTAKEAAAESVRHLF